MFELSNFRIFIDGRSKILSIIKVYKRIMVKLKAQGWQTYHGKIEGFTNDFRCKLDSVPSILYGPIICSVWVDIEPVKHHAVRLLCIMHKQWVVGARVHSDDGSRDGRRRSDSLEEGDRRHISQRYRRFLCLGFHVITHDTNDSYMKDKDMKDNSKTSESIIFLEFICFYPQHIDTIDLLW